jgi:hypothetical protein
MMTKTVHCPDTIREFPGGSCQWIEIHELPRKLLEKGPGKHRAARWLIASGIIGLLILGTLALPSFAW